MSPWLWVVIVVFILVVAALAVWAAMRNRSRQLRERFGPEYETTMRESSSQRQAESELGARQKRVSSFQIRPLSAAERERATADWRRIQARFVDSPAPAVKEADEMVLSVMKQRGYPMDDFEQRAADLSVHHGNVVRHYRAAHGISLASEQDMATTEDLRQALVHYRALFDELLEPQAEQTKEASA